MFYKGKPIVNGFIYNVTGFRTMVREEVPAEAMRVLPKTSTVAMGRKKRKQRAADADTLGDWAEAAFATGGAS